MFVMLQREVKGGENEKAEEAKLCCRKKGEPKAETKIPGKRWGWADGKRGEAHKDWIKETGTASRSGIPERK